MKLSTYIPFLGGAAVGYVLGAAAGHERYQQLVGATSRLVAHPRVQQVVFDLAEQVRTSSARLPGPAAGLVAGTATRVEDRLTRPSDTAEPQPADPTTGEPV